MHRTFHLRATSVLIATLVLTLSSFAHAQTAAEHASEPTDAARDAELFERPPRHEPRNWQPQRGEFVVSLIGGIVGVGASVLVGKLVYEHGVNSCLENDGEDCGYAASFEGAFAMLLTAPFLSTAGVFLGGELTGGSGGYGWTLLGGVAGTLSVLGVAGLLSLLPGDDTAAEVTATISVPAFIVGAALGYRWSADNFDASLAIAPDGRGAQLTIRGAL